MSARIHELRELERGRPAVAGNGMTISISDFYTRCLVLLDHEQKQLNPDNALISLLCEAIRFTREHVNLVNRYLSAPLNVRGGDA